ncbi:MAG TPA: hypothetical protein VFT22_40065 [Kofleriaceae bacterium]|nr:hypothetical protein [Kofleriaceae bacterium]
MKQCRSSERRDVPVNFEVIVEVDDPIAPIANGMPLFHRSKPW